MQSFVAWLACESVDRSTCCMKHDVASYVLLVTLSQPYKTEKMYLILIITFYILNTIKLLLFLLTVVIDY